GRLAGRRRQVAEGIRLDPWPRLSGREHAFRGRVGELAGAEDHAAFREIAATKPRRKRRGLLSTCSMCRSTRSSYGPTRCNRAIWCRLSASPSEKRSTPPG